MDESQRLSIAATCRSCGYDVSVYDESFLSDSLKKRFVDLEFSDVDAYCTHLKENPTEAIILWDSLQICYTHFFRDSITSALLKESILPALTANNTSGSELRIWSAGCSTGQEPYSLAMILCDLAATWETDIRFRIVATDISDQALEAARSGLYPESALADVTLQQLNSYFTKHGKLYQICPEIMNHVQFSTYDLLDSTTATPPDGIYGNFDIIVCSNVLIYYTPELQKVIVEKLRSALSPKGYLITGESEKTLLNSTPRLRMMLSPTSVFQPRK